MIIKIITKEKFMSKVFLDLSIIKDYSIYSEMREELLNLKFSMIILDFLEVFGKLYLLILEMLGKPLIYIKLYFLYIILNILINGIILIIKDLLLNLNIKKRKITKME